MPEIDINGLINTADIEHAARQLGEAIIAAADKSNQGAAARELVSVRLRIAEKESDLVARDKVSQLTAHAISQADRLWRHGAPATLNAMVSALSEAKGQERGDAVAANFVAKVDQLDAACRNLIEGQAERAWHRCLGDLWTEYQRWTGHQSEEPSAHA